jgi:hypothetical protein
MYTKLNIGARNRLIALLFLGGAVSLVFAGTPCADPLSPSITSYGGQLVPGVPYRCTADVIRDGGCINPGHSAYTCHAFSDTFGYHTYEVEYVVFGDPPVPNPTGCTSTSASMVKMFRASTTEPCDYCRNGN